MKNGILFVIKSSIGVASLWVFYLVYIHVISIISIPVSIVYTLFIAVILILALGNLLVNIKDFIVSIFKDDETLDEKGFKKHF